MNKKTDKAQKKATYAFIDASNIIYGARAEGWFIDQKKLFRYLKKKFSTSKAFFYYGKDSKNEKQEKFLKKLKTFGYALRVKAIKRFGERTKANCDVDMAFYLMREIKNYDRILVLSGDGDFLPVLKYLRKIGKEIIILSRGSRTAREIRQFAGNKFMDFNYLREMIKISIE